MKQHSYRERKARGFLLLVIIGLLAVLLVLCIGFLSFTRAEVTSVAGLRNRTDCNNLVQSALDFTLARIVNDTFTGTQMDPSKPVAHTRDKSDPLHRSWYKPSADVGSRSMGHGNDGAEWFYLPANYFSDGFARARVRVQVSDTNGCININDWMEDANPTQAQMAHMLQDACDDTYAERERAKKLTHYSNTAPFNNGSVLHQNKYPNWTPPQNYNCDGGHPGYLAAQPLKRCPYHQYPRKPLRYLDGFRMGTHTMAFSHSNGFVGPWSALNDPYFTDLCAEGGAGSTTIDRILNSSSTQHWLNEDAFLGYYTYPNGRYAYYHTCYTDPDTGRSPVNVNTGFPSGLWWDDRKVCDLVYYSDRIWFDRVMRGVFNLEALRRIVRIGKCYVTRGANPTKYPILASQLYETPLSATEPAGAPLNTWSADEIKQARAAVETLRGQLAIQYQETLVRYFSAWYRARDFYTPVGYVRADANYKDRYASSLGAANTGDGEVKFYCKTFDMQKARFPYGLDDFRRNCKLDLTAMTVMPRNPVYDPSNPQPNTKIDIEGFVGVDDRGNFEIAAGKMDRRTACAVFDNIIPGSATLFPAETDDQIRYPLKQLYEMRLARDEQSEALFTFPEREGPGSIPIGVTTPRTKGFPKTISYEMGRDIAKAGAPGVGAAGSELGPWEARSDVPERQLIFGPDWFSTELTTSTTTYVVVIGAQIVDTSTGLTTPNILFNRYMGYIVEVAPDVKNETSGSSAWTTSGLAYYKEGMPRKRLTDRDFMDKGLGNPAVAIKPPGRNDAGGVLIPGTDTSAALEWFDFRGVPAGQESAYYDSAAQTKLRVVVRRVMDFNANSN
ncbi:MAG TPA: hypothetical protein VEJ63_14880 [Planctomycetota bacterium]|nr:hypothetical protein [Planctomycetota bacterium]